MLNATILEIFALVAFLAHAAGVLAAIHAVMTARTAQGSIAWALCLIFLPYVALPAYGLVGRGKFQGYVKARRAGDSQIDHLARNLEKKLRLFRVRDDEFDPKYVSLEKLAAMPFTSHNDA